MPIRGSGVAAVVLLVAACGAATPSPGPASSTSPVPTNAPSPPSSPAVTAVATPVAQDLTLYALPQANELLRGAAVASLASGRSGVVMLGNDRATGALISWTSADGGDWARHWLPGSTFGGGTPDLLVGGSFGYLALGWRIEPVTHPMVEGIAFPRDLWTSIDGVNWALAPSDGLPDGEITALVSGPSGVAALIEGSPEREHSAVAVTSDGRVWHTATIPGGASPWSDGLVALPHGFLLLGQTAVPGSAGETASTEAAWRLDDGLHWTADPELATQLQQRENSIDHWQLSRFGAVGWSSGTGMGPVLLTPFGLDEIPGADAESWAAQVVAGPAGLVWAFGADRSASCVSAWQYGDDGFKPLAGTTPDMGCLETAGPALLGSAALPDAMVIVGALGTDRDRVAWLVRAPGRPPTGAAGGGPIEPAPAASIPDPLAAGIDHSASCGAMPTTMHALLELAPAAVVGCFGDRTVTVKAWVRDPGEGYGGTCGPFEPVWIRECVLPDYLLTEGRVVGQGDVPTLHVMRSPKAKGDIKGVGRWVHVEGHYDDPASTSCRATGDVEWVGLEPEEPAALMVSACRLVFVVTDIRTVH